MLSQWPRSERWGKAPFSIGFGQREWRVEAGKGGRMDAVDKVPFLESRKSLMASLRGADFLLRQVTSWESG